ncbi:MAG: hypothetical protein ACXACB_11020, partial [Promethearchaeota archaeon]
DQIGEKIRHHSVLLNASVSNIGSAFTFEDSIYTNGSQIELGNKMILSANINVTTQRPTTTVTSVSVYYIDKNNYTDDNYRIYYNDTAGANWYRLQIDMRAPPEIPPTLAGDKYGVYGLRIVVAGTNSSNIWGDLNVTLFETTNIYNVTDLCKLNVRVIDSVGAGVVGVIVQVNSTNNRDGSFQVDLETRDSPNDNLKGYAFGQTNIELPLWFLRGYAYNFSLVFFGGHKDLIVNSTTPAAWKPPGNVFYYNFTLNQKSNITFELFLGVGVNASDFQTRFEAINIVETVTWGDFITIQTNFTLTENGWDTSSPVTLPATVTCYIKTTGPGSIILKQFSMTSIGSGIFDLSFNSSLLSAGNGGKLYGVIISGSKSGYTSPTNGTGSFFIASIQTSLTMHDYYNSLNTITETSQRFGESVNLTFRYYNETNSPLKEAILTYEWLNLNPIQFYEDPLNAGYYTVTIDTSLAETWGSKSIKISASLENYTSMTILASLLITERLTTLNDETDLVYINSKVWIEDSNPFDFVYKDVITDENIGNLTTAAYSWEELYANGTRKPGVSGTGTLIQNINKTYTLDFNTEIKPVGFYYLYITLQKQNYEVKSALVNLEITLREFSYDIDEPTLGNNNQISIKQGSDISFEINLWDLSRNEELQGARIKINFRGVNNTFNPTATLGGYDTTLITSTIDTFLSGKTFVAIIYLEADNFTKQEFAITITVKMEEIFAGIPTFYFILITASVIGVLGSVVAYRVIQQARIPKHVKKIRKVKSMIKSKKKISETVSIPTKEQMILKLFGNDWSKIGVSLEEALGIKDLKAKKVQREVSDTKIVKEKIKKQKEPKKKKKKEKVEPQKISEEKKKKDDLPVDEIPKERGEDE